ncbi:MAG: hypothetical protein DRN91_04740, partial [Candidatus Alkanophagales archaeon]
LTLGGELSLLPTDNDGQTLGDSTHRWNLYTQEIRFHGETGDNLVYFPDNYAAALEFLDHGDPGESYLTFVSTTGSREVVFNEGGADIDFRVEGVGETNALFVQGSDGVTTIADLIIASGGNIVPIDTEFQTLGDETHRWDLYTQSIIFGGPTGDNIIEIPNDLADALIVIDDNDNYEYFRIRTSAQREVVFNDDGADIDYRVEASGEANALFVRGSDGNVGVGTATLAAGTKFSSYHDVALTTGTVIGIYTFLRNTPGAASTALLYGYYGDVRNAGNNDGYVQALYRGACRWYGSGTLTSAYGFWPSVTNNEAGTITTATGVLGYVSQSGAGGTIGTAIGLRADVNLSAGTINVGYGLYVSQVEATNAYGIYIANTIAGSTAGWAIYSAATEDSYLAGALGIQMTPTANGILCIGLPTENLEIIDAGSAGATEQDWIQIEIGGNTGYIRVHAAK